MFNFISLDEAKLQLGFDPDDMDTDQSFSESELNMFIQDATSIVALEINRPVYETEAELIAAKADMTAGPFAISLETANKGIIVKRLTKLLVAHMYQHRYITNEDNARAVFMTYGHALSQIKIPIYG